MVLKMKNCVFFVSIIWLLISIGACTDSQQTTNKEGSGTIVFNPTIDGEWIGLGVAYGSYRDGESPDDNSVSSEADILEDMKILTESKALRFHLIRMYGADAASEQVLKTIRKHSLPVRVMQGAWLSGADPMEDNEEQLSELIRLANEYPDIIVAVNLGNEILVDWSAHKFEVQQIPMYLDWVDRVKKATNVPVTLADDYNFWNKEWSQPVAEKLDFIVLHAYAMWNSQTLENAVVWTEQVFNDISALHPNKQIVLGESGWATSKMSENGDEQLIIAEASENAQSVFLAEYRNWLEINKIASFYFEAFDEKWKGGGAEKPDGIAEKNWGLYRSDRSAKQAVTDFNH
jgi:exo-beta-1,3-glucanase (GH17 family)